MAHTVKDAIMDAGWWAADVDNTPVVLDKLTVLVDGERRPRYLWALVKDQDGALAYPPFVLRSVEPSKEGLVIGGPSVLWSEGSKDVGPTIRDREYVSGSDKLSNGPFNLGDLYWRRPSELSNWVIAGGRATNAGGLTIDDVLESDEKFPTRPGDGYLLQATGVTGSGRLRGRVTFEGRYNPANFFTDPSLEGGGTEWASPPAGVDIVNDPANAQTGDWVMRFSPSVQPEFFDDPGLETASGWTADSRYPADIAIVTDGANAFSGTKVMKVGPVTQKQLLLNSDMETATGTFTLANWYTSSDLHDPDVGIFYPDPGGGVEGSKAATTDGAAFSDRTIRYLRSDASDGTSGVQAYTVVAGETWLCEAEVRCAPNTDGYAYLSLVFPHPTLEPLHPRWSVSPTVEGPRNSTDEFHRISVSDTVPAGRTKVYVLGEVHDQTTGYVAFDRVTLTRTRGNRAQLNYNTTFTVVPDARYEFSVLARSADELQVGEMRVGVVLSGPGMVDQIIDVSQGSTDFVWTKVAVEVRPPSGYTTARPFVAAMDIVGAPIYVDEVHFRRVEGNSVSLPTFSSKLVTPGRRYRWSISTRSTVGATRGKVQMTVRCFRTGYPAVEFDSPVQEITGGTWKVLTWEFSPPSGYDTVVPRITGADIEGGLFVVDDLDLRDIDTTSVDFETPLDDPVAVALNVPVIAPPGSEFVRVSFVADGQSGPWSIEAASLARTGVTPATAAAIVADLLVDPDTGDAIMAAGTIDCPDVIPYDWVLQNLTNREALDHLCSVVADPPLEYRVEASDPPALSVAVAETLFTDHGPVSVSPVVLREEDEDVQTMGHPILDASERATHIIVIGAERQTVSGRPILITATAEVPAPAEYAPDGRLIRRPKIVSAGTVDHFGYAQALADDLAAKEARSALSVDVKLDNISAETAALLGVAHRPEVIPGDWVYPYDPEGGIEGVGYDTTVEGEPVSPRRVRVLSRQRALGPRYHVVMRGAGGVEFPLTGINPSPEDTTVLTIGDRLLDWQADPQGQAEGVQYLRDRASRPR